VHPAKAKALKRRKEELYLFPYINELLFSISLKKKEK